MTQARGFGVAGALDRAIVRELASAAEAADYRTFWVNDTPNGDGLAALAEAARVTDRIRLGVGVVPLDRQAPEGIVARIRELKLPTDRLTLGVGAGGDARGLDRVRAGATKLREESGATVTVGALGPRMCALAGEVADGVLLSWLTPALAETSAAIVRDAAKAAGRPTPRIDSYFRTALGTAALPRLRQEAQRYASFPKYAAHFRRMGVEAIDTCVTGETATELDAGLSAFAGVLDETVVRAITANETAEEYLALLEAAAPR